MTTQIDFRTLPANVPVLCIPRVYPNISESRIRRIFDDLGMGTLERVDIVSKTSEKGEKFNRVFVHFRKWNDSENANIARERLLNGKEIKIIYDDPWFWKISAYREAERKTAPPQQPSGRGKATIAFDSDEDKSSKPHVSTNSYNRDERRRDDRRDERPRRRDDSRERPRKQYDVHHKVTNALESNRYERRRDDSRERPRRRPDSRERPRRDDRRQPAENKPSKQEMPMRKFTEARTPSNSPPRERPVDAPKTEVPMNIDYGNIMPPPKRRPIGGKKPELKIEKEEGEVSESDEKKVENV